MRPAASGRDRTQYRRTGNNQKLLRQLVHPVQQRGALLVAHVLRHRESRMLLGLLLRVARTVADLAGKRLLDEDSLLEALQYRAQEKVEL